MGWARLGGCYLSFFFPRCRYRTPFSCYLFVCVVHVLASSLCVRDTMRCGVMWVRFVDCKVREGRREGGKEGECVKYGFCYYLFWFRSVFGRLNGLNGLS